MPARGRQCVQCGQDEWRKVTRGYACIPCNRRQSREYQARRQAADPLFVLWRGARSRARAKGIEFSITPADIAAVWPADGLCPALGIPLRVGRGAATDNSPTLDRKIGRRGYTKDNIAVLSYTANRAKGNLRAEELEKIAAWMRRNGLD